MKRRKTGQSSPNRGYEGGRPLKRFLANICKFRNTGKVKEKNHQINKKIQHHVPHQHIAATAKVVARVLLNLSIAMACFQNKSIDATALGTTLWPTAHHSGLQIDRRRPFLGVTGVHLRSSQTTTIVVVEAIVATKASRATATSVIKIGVHHLGTPPIETFPTHPVR